MDPDNFIDLGDFGDLLASTASPDLLQYFSTRSLRIFQLKFSPDIPTLNPRFVRQNVYI